MQLPMSHGTPFNSNVHISVLNCGLWDRCIVGFVRFYINGLAPDCSHATACAPELPHSCNKPSEIQNKTNWSQQISPWWRHQMETFSALLAICAGNSPVPVEFPPQRPVTRSFDVYFDLRPNKRLSKQSWGWWFATLSWSLWRRCNDSPQIAASHWILLPPNRLQHETIFEQILWWGADKQNTWNPHHAIILSPIQEVAFRI